MPFQKLKAGELMLNADFELFSHSFCDVRSEISASMLTAFLTSASSNSSTVIFSKAAMKQHNLILDNLLNYNNSNVIVLNCNEDAYSVRNTIRKTPSLLSKNKLFIVEGAFNLFSGLRSTDSISSFKKYIRDFACSHTVIFSDYASKSKINIMSFIADLSNTVVNVGSLNFISSEMLFKKPITVSNNWNIIIRQKHSNKLRMFHLARI